MKILVFVWVEFNASWSPVGTAHDGTTFYSLLRLVSANAALHRGSMAVRLDGTTNGTDRIDGSVMDVDDAHYWWTERMMHDEKLREMLEPNRAEQDTVMDRLNFEQVKRPVV